MARKRRPGRLSAAFVRTVTDPGRYGDGFGGFGLSLLVKRRKHGGVAKSWSQRLWIGGKGVNVGLGQYPVVLLSEARQRALENRRTVEQGGDPRQRSGSAVPTFAEACERVIAVHAATWKGGGRTAENWRASLRDYALARLGSMPVDTITPADVLAVVLPIWTAKHTTAERVRVRIGAVLKWTVAEGYRADNPAGDAITAALPRNGGHNRGHHRAAAHADMADVLSKVRVADAWKGAKLALEFVALTATRAAEVRGMTWREVEAATWTIQAARMKTAREHRVPLSRQALRVLDEARTFSGGADERVFPSQTGKQMTNAVLLRVLTGMDTGTTTHGMRSAFRSWAADTGADREVAEAALAHTVKGVEGAYQRSDLFERRRDVMQAWADYIGKDDPS